jgi:hypothetical protein
MKLDAVKGDRVQFVHTTAGLKCHSDLAHEYLQVDGVYTVERVEVRDFDSRVYLQEITDVGFNVVLFDDVVDICPCCDGSGFDPENNINVFLKCPVCKGEGTLKGSEFDKANAAKSYPNEWDRIWNESSFLNTWDRIWSGFNNLAMEGLNEHDQLMLRSTIEKNWPKVVYNCVDDLTCETRFGTYSKKKADEWAASDPDRWYQEIKIS